MLNTEVPARVLELADEHARRVPFFVAASVAPYEHLRRRREHYPGNERAIRLSAEFWCSSARASGSERAVLAEVLRALDESPHYADALARRMHARVADEINSEERRAVAARLYDERRSNLR